MLKRDESEAITKSSIMCFRQASSILFMERNKFYKEFRSMALNDYAVNQDSC